jgi:hypothetical protein
VSRYYDDGESGMPYGLWAATVRRSLRSPRGQRALRDLREALLALPEPRLIEGALCTVGSAGRLGALPEKYGGRIELADSIEENGEGVCAIGALLWHRKVKAGADPDGAFGSLPTLEDENHDLNDTAYLAVSDAGIAYSLAWSLAYRNDETYGDLTPEDRYARFLAWINAELGDSAMQEAS